MFTKPLRVALLLLAAASLFAALPARAQNGYPEPQEPYVNDFAGLLTPDTASSIRALLADLRSTRGIEMTVVTIGSINDYRTGDSTLESFATNLFNTWGIGSAQRNDGVLLLVAVQDRRMRIEVGSGYGSSMNTPMQRVIENYMLPAFRDNAYDYGIYSGVRQTIATLTGSLPAEPVGAPQQVVSGGSSAASTPLVVGLVGAGAAGLGGGLWGLRRYLRLRPRACPQCSKPMHRLWENMDDEFLNAGEQHEERLNSVDYDVWECATCGTHLKYHYNNYFSGYGHCSACRYRTLRSTSVVEIPATTSSSGRRRVTQHCQHCGYQHQYTVTIPRKTSSSSGGSFSGGRSSGGGASGSW